MPVHRLTEMVSGLAGPIGREGRGEGTMEAEREATTRARAMHRACLEAREAGRRRVRDDGAVRCAGHALARATGTVEVVSCAEYDALETRCEEKGRIVERVAGTSVAARDRHRSALAMTRGGACNPSGILRSVVEACEEVEREGADPGRDDAVRLMMTQVTWIVDCTGRTGEAGAAHGQARAA